MKCLCVALLAAGLAVSARAQLDTTKWISHYNGIDGWFAFQGPQRAMDLNPPDFGLSHPVQVESLKTWWYWGMGSWTDSVFTFRIYGGDGQTLLWESESLTAPTSYWVYYGLDQPVRIDTGKFYIATTHRRVDPYAHPGLRLPAAGFSCRAPARWRCSTLRAGDSAALRRARTMWAGFGPERTSWSGGAKRPRWS